MRTSYFRCEYKLKNKLTLFLQEYKVVIFIGSIVLMFGAIVGVFTVIKYSADIKIDNLSDTGLVEFVKGNKGTMGLYFPYLFGFLFSAIIIIFTNFKPVFCVFSYLVLAVKGYLLGFDITILIIVYGLWGIVNSIVLILPFELIICFVLILISAIAIKQNCSNATFGKLCGFKNYTFDNAKIYGFFIFIAAITLLLKCLIMPLIRVTIIINWSTNLTYRLFFFFLLNQTFNLHNWYVYV